MKWLGYNNIVAHIFKYMFTHLKAQAHLQHYFVFIRRIHIFHKIEYFQAEKAATTNVYMAYRETETKPATNNNNKKTKKNSVIK